MYEGSRWVVRLKGLGFRRVADGCLGLVRV